MRCSASIYAMIALAAVLCAPVILEAQNSLTDPVTPAYATVAGAAVYGERNERIGSIRQVLFANSDDTYSVVLSLGDFSLVEVPGSLIQVANGKLMIAGVTRDQLMQLPKYQAGSRS
jgi:hypothetical protein